MESNAYAMYDTSVSVLIPCLGCLAIPLRKMSALRFFISTDEIKILAMNILFLRDDILKIIEIPQKIPSPSTEPPNLFFLFLLLLVASFAIVFFEKKPFIEFDEDGNTKLAEWREEKLNKELKELDEAEQYVLLAKRNGMYPCFNCPKSITIYLNRNEVWKYGYTKKGESGRYQTSLEGKNLRYVIQFTGTIGECMKEEKRKIYYYALMPENLKREIPLMRPPGNKQDN